MFSLDSALSCLFEKGFIIDGTLNFPKIAMIMFPLFIFILYVLPMIGHVVNYMLFSTFHEEEYAWLWNGLIEEQHIKNTLREKMKVAAIGKKLCHKKLMSAYYKSTGVTNWSSEIDWRTIMCAFVGSIDTGEDLYDSFNDFIMNVFVQSGDIKLA